MKITIEYESDEERGAAAALLHGEPVTEFVISKPGLLRRFFAVLGMILSRE